VIDEWKRLLRDKSNGSRDTSWGNSGEVRLPAKSRSEYEDFSDPDVMILGGRVYLLCSGRLYVLDDEMARVETTPAAAEPAQSGDDVWWLIVLAVVTAGGVVFDTQRRAKH